MLWGWQGASLIREDKDRQDKGTGIQESIPIGEFGKGLLIDCSCAEPISLISKK